MHRNRSSSAHAALREVRALEKMTDKFVPIELGEHRNNVGCSYDGSIIIADFDGDGNSYPAEELPSGRAVTLSSGVTFLFPTLRAGVPDNMALEGQRIRIPEGKHRWLWILGASSNGNQAEEIGLLICGSVERDRVVLGLSSWHGFDGPVFGETVGLRCRGFHAGDLGDTVTGKVSRDVYLWSQGVPLPFEKPIEGIRMMDNPCMHIFAVTIVSLTR